MGGAHASEKPLRSQHLGSLDAWERWPNTASETKGLKSNFHFLYSSAHQVFLSVCPSAFEYMNKFTVHTY